MRIWVVAGLFLILLIINVDVSFGQTDRELPPSMPLSVKSDITIQQTSCYVTSSDNANNTGQQTPDFDMGSSNCIYDSNFVHPIEFFINVPSAASSAQLSIVAYDIDQFC